MCTYCITPLAKRLCVTPSVYLHLNFMIYTLFLYIHLHPVYMRTPFLTVCRLQTTCIFNFTGPVTYDICYYNDNLLFLLTVPKSPSTTMLIRECGSTLYLGFQHAVPPTNTNFQITFLLTLLPKALYDILHV